MIRKFLFPFIIVAILGLAYTLTLAPGLSWANGGADGGDLITAVAVNGVPHPTGYPLYLIIAKLFQWIPISNLAFRTNLLSAFCTILASLLVYQTIFYLQKGNKYGSLSAITAALIFGLSPLVWSQAVIAEVYGLQSLLTIGIVYQTIKMGNKPSDDFFLGLLFGLSLSNHITAIFLLPLLILEKENFKIITVSQLLSRGFGLLLGLTDYLILPFRSLNQPPINWFNPRNFNNFYQLVSGHIYQTYFSMSYALDRARAWFGILIENFSLPLIYVGLCSLFEKKEYKRIKLLAVWIFLAYGVFALIYASYDSDVYLIQTILAYSLLIGISLDEIIKFLARRWHLTERVLFPFLILFFALRFIIVEPKVNAANDDRAERFGNQVLESVPDKAMVFTRDDYSTFALWYFHFANGKRLDINVIAEGLLKFDWYRQSLGSTYSSLIIPNIPDLAPFHLIEQNPDLPFCFVEYRDSTIINCSRFK